MPGRNAGHPPGRLIIVANRLPFRPVREKDGIVLQRTAGGLVSALLPLAERVGAPWVGWDGGESEASARALRRSRGKHTPFPLVPVALDDAVREPFYSGFCNASLWPLFHGFLGRSEFSAHGFAAYEAANAVFAERTLHVLRPGDTIWVHDFHLLLLPGLLRAARVRARIVFFLHIPFPAPDHFRHIPWRTELLRGLAACNVVGLQRQEDVRHLRESLETLLPVRGARTSRGRAPSKPELRANPISIDTRRLSQAAREPVVTRRAESIRNAFHGRKVVLSVERLDCAKGILERLRMIEHLLETRPDLRDHVSFLQLSVPTRPGVRSYEGYRREVDEAGGRINGRFSRPEWVPFRYLFRSLPESELLAYYRAADVMLITSLKDGMNLVAKEYVAARSGHGGVLVLSEFAGAAQHLRGALLINPHHVVATAAAVTQALELPPAEQQRRMRSMYRYLLRHTVHDWVRECLA